MRPLADGSRAAILLNRGTEAADLTVSWEDIGLAPTGKAAVRDRWKKADAGSFTGSFKSKVEPHGVVMLRVTPQS